MAMESQQEIELVLAEYQQSREQFNFLMDHRVKIFDWYSKLVLIPTGAISYIGLYGEIGDQSEDFSVGMALLLVGVFAVGMFMYGYYVSETFASRRFQHQTTRVRALLAEAGSSSRLKIAFGNHRDIYGDIAGAYVPFFRGMAFGSMNSLIFAMAAFFATDRLLVAVAAFIGSFVFHYYFYQLIHEAVSPVSLKRTIKDLARKRSRKKS